MQQLGFDFMKAEHRIDAPTVLHVDLGKYSDAQIIICQNDDGSWRAGSDDHFQGYCGHGGSGNGSYPTFEDALSYRIRWLRKRWSSIAASKHDSCCSDSHKRMARVGLAWLDTLIADYALNIGEGLCDA
jgi:hypothetical protein|nr:MAG TPA: hypothetical protein [Caudoviricetes sp.]